MEITTDRLLLRHWKKGDPCEASSLYRFASDPEIGPKCGWEPHSNVEESTEAIENVLTGPENYAITLRSPQTIANGVTIETGLPVGAIELKATGERDHATSSVREALEAHDLSDGVDEDGIQRLLDQSAHELVLGYWIGRPFWGNGLMTEALKAILHRSFASRDESGLEANAVWGGHYVENIGSGKVMEHCGLQPVCRIKNDYFPLIDERHDCVIRVITREQWEAQSRVWGSGLTTQM